MGLFQRKRNADTAHFTSPFAEGLRDFTFEHDVSAFTFAASFQDGNACDGDGKLENIRAVSLHGEISAVGGALEDIAFIEDVVDDETAVLVLCDVPFDAGSEAFWSAVARFAYSVASARRCADADDIADETSKKTVRRCRCANRIAVVCANISAEPKPAAVANADFLVELSTFSARVSSKARGEQVRGLLCAGVLGRNTDARCAYVPVSEAAAERAAYRFGIGFLDGAAKWLPVLPSQPNAATALRNRLRLSTALSASIAILLVSQIAARNDPQTFSMYSNRNELMKNELGDLSSGWWLQEIARKKTKIEPDDIELECDGYVDAFGKSAIGIVPLSWCENRNGSEAENAWHTLRTICVCIECVRFSDRNRFAENNGFARASFVSFIATEAPSTSVAGIAARTFIEGDTEFVSAENASAISHGTLASACKAVENALQACAAICKARVAFGKEDANESHVSFLREAIEANDNGIPLADLISPSVQLSQRAEDFVSSSAWRNMDARRLIVEGICDGGGSALEILAKRNDWWRAAKERAFM